MTNKKHILIFTTAFRPFIGGSELAIEEINKRLPDFNFDIITPRYTRKLPRVDECGNVRIFRVGHGLASDKFLFPFMGFLIARKLLASYNYQIIHAYQASYAAGAAWLLKLFNSKLKFILTLQEGKNLDAQSRVIRWSRRVIIKKADTLTVISNYLRDYAKRFNKKAKLAVIPNGVDIKNFSRDFSYGELSSVADQLGIKPGEKVIISVSRLVPKNGVDILIGAFRVLNSKLKIENSKLLIVGDGPEKKNLELQISNLKLIDNVIFAGSISHADLPKYLKISDVFVRPSRSEGLGSAFLEAMAAGLPIIATKVGGIPDFLKDPSADSTGSQQAGSGQATGLFTEIDNPENLAEKINLILTNKELRERIVKNAKELIIQKYDWDKIAGEFRELYLLNI